jgi:hypothetical protein
MRRFGLQWQDSSSAHVPRLLQLVQEASGRGAPAAEAALRMMATAPRGTKQVAAVTPGGYGLGEVNERRGSGRRSAHKRWRRPIAAWSVLTVAKGSTAPHDRAASSTRGLQALRSAAFLLEG